MLRGPLRIAISGNTRLTAKRRGERTGIACIKHSYGRDSVRLVAWLSIPPIPQIIGKGALEF